MTKTDFEALAKTFADHLATMEPVDEPGFYFDGSAYDALKDLANAQADYFTSKNPRFNRAKFLTAAGF